MKYKAGDKFIIEIWNKAKVQGLYTIKGFRTLVFDDNGLDRLEQVYEHDGCKGCKYEDVSSVDYPCSSCTNAYFCKWEPQTEEIQVGDEVVHNSREKAVVFRVTEQKVYALYQMPENPFSTLMRCEWDKEKCTRTGRTYPELIKALENLPRE